MAVKNGSLAIGIDLGTTNSCMGVWRRGGIEIIPNSLGKRTTPSYVSFSDRELHIGDAAKNHTATDPKNIIFDAKRLIGKKFTDEPVQRDIKLWPFEVISGPDQKPMIVVSNKGERKLLSAEQITSFVLTKLQQIAKDFLGSDIKDVVITVPAYFNDSQRQATKDAGRIAGLNVLQILAEPTAAALAYGYQIKSDGVGQKNVLVFDLGGGTFDISIVSVGNGDVKVKAVGGETHFGGLNFDNNMVDHLIAEFKRKHKEDISSSPKALRKLRTACETAKMILSSDTEATIEIDSLYNKIDFEYTISRSLFEKLNQNLFSRCLEIVKECLKDANMDKKSIDDILLIGGSTRIPKVQSMLQQFFDGKELSKKINPDEAVAYGAAIHAAHLSSCKVQDMVIHDVTPLSLGTDIVGDIMGVIIPRNTTIPIKKEKFYVTSKDNQKNMSIKVYEGERSNIKDNHLLGNFTLDGIPLAPKGGVRVAVSFEIDMNGILTVTAQDKKTGKKMEKVINNEKNGLSNDQIKKMIFEVEKFKEEDKKFKKRAEARNALGSLVYDLRECIANRKNLQSKDKEGIEDEIEHTEQWINKNKNVMGDHFENEYKEQLRRIAGCLKNASATSSSSHTGKKNHKATESVQHVHNFIVDMDLSPVTNFLLGP